MLRKATRDDKRVLDGLGEFVESLELDILKEVSQEKFYEIFSNQQKIDLVINTVRYMKKTMKF